MTILAPMYVALAEVFALLQLVYSVELIIMCM